MPIREQNLVMENMHELSQAQSKFAAQKKKEILHSFESIPMPKEKDEDWRYTNIDKFSLDNFDLDKSKTIIKAALSEELIEKGIILTDINTALDKHQIAKQYFLKNLKTGNDKFVALNASYFNSGIFLYIPKNIELDKPIRINFEVEENSIIHNIIIVDSNSKIDFIEEYTNKANNEQVNAAVTEVFADNNSKINFYHINNWTKDIYNFTSINGTIERDATINWISGCFGGKINRLRINTNFNGQGSQCRNLGIFLGKEKEHIDFTTNVYHNAENTTNDILVDGILKDESSSVYRGLIKIEKQAQKTNSYLANHILKLGEKTLANSIPSLKIDANDVKASHGATVGKIDEEHLFYLMARGLPRQEAERLIVEGFFEPVIQKIPLEELRERIREMVKG